MLSLKKPSKCRGTGVKEMGDPVTVGTELIASIVLSPNESWITLDSDVCSYAEPCVVFFLIAGWKETYMVENSCKGIFWLRSTWMLLIGWISPRLLRLSHYAGETLDGNLAVSLVVDQYPCAVNTVPIM